MTQYVVQNNIFNNINADYNRVSTGLPIGSPEDFTSINDSGTSAMNFEDADDAQSTEIHQDGGGSDSDGMNPVGQGHGEMFYAYGEGENSSQLYLISEVLDENTGQMVNVAIPVDVDASSISSLVGPNMESVAASNENEANENTTGNVSTNGQADHVAAESTDATDITDNSLELSTMAGENDNLMMPVDELSLSSQLDHNSFLQIDSKSKSGFTGIDIELSDESDTTEITVKEEGADEETTTTEFRIVQTGNRVIVRNSEGVVVNEFPLPESPNPSELTYADATERLGEILTGINPSLITSFDTPSRSQESRSKEVYKPLTPVIRKKKGTKRKPSEMAAVQIKIDKCENSADLAIPDDETKLPFCYSGEAFNMQSQKLILNVYDFFKKVNKGVISSLCIGSPAERAAAVLNVSQSVISRVKKRFSEGRINFSQDSSPPRKEGCKRVVDIITSSDENVIRNIIDEFAKKGITPTIPMLLQAAKERIGFPGSRSSFRRVLQRIGYKSPIPNKKKTVILSIKKENRNASSSVCSESPRSSICNPFSANCSSGNSLSSPISPDAANNSSNIIKNNQSWIIHREPPIIKFYYGPLDTQDTKSELEEATIPTIPFDVDAHLSSSLL